MNKEKLKADYFEFLADDDTQSFIFVLIAFSILLKTGSIDMQSFTKIMMVATGAFYGQKITN